MKKIQKYWKVAEEQVTMLMILGLIGKPDANMVTNQLYEVMVRELEKKMVKLTTR